MLLSARGSRNWASETIAFSGGIRETSKRASLEPREVERFGYFCNSGYEYK